MYGLTSQLEKDKSAKALRLWWLSPIAASIFVALASMVPTALTADSQFRSLWKTPKWITTDTLLLFACGVLAMSFGVLLAGAVVRPKRHYALPWPNLSDHALTVLRRASTVLTLATVVGYGGFIFLIARAGLTPASLIAGTSDDGADLKERIGTIPGVTTLTQLGIAAVVVSAVLLAREFTRSELAKMLIVIGLAVPRAYIYSERLALLELLIPAGVVAAAKLSTGSRARRRISQVIPVVGLVSIVPIFATFEYFRSWNFYRLHGETSFANFAMGRFAGYYTTALNNGQLIIDHLRWPGRWPFDTLEFFWSAPGISNVGLYEHLSGYERLSGHARPYSNVSDLTPFAEMLKQYANPEFNNPSGYAGPFVDYGRFGGLVFLLLIGFLIGLAYRGFCNAQLWGVLLYPVIFTGVVEMPRYIYWVQGRVTYAWLAILIIVVVVARSRRASSGSQRALSRN